MKRTVHFLRHFLSEEKFYDLQINRLRYLMINIKKFIRQEIVAVTENKRTSSDR